MKKTFSFFLSSISVFSLLIFSNSCKKINESTELGSDLIPAVDNITTFETNLNTETNNALLTDTTELTFSDYVALGNISNDPEFGMTNANVYFSVSAPSYGSYPFSSKDNLVIDSVVLSLSYIGSYADSATPQSIEVFEIDPSSTFNDSTYYKFSQTDFPILPTVLGTKMFVAKDLKDTLTLKHKETTKTANELRIRLNNSLGNRFASYDATTVNDAYNNDNAFKKLFKGVGIKANTGTGNGLSYFSLNDNNKTKITIYYRAEKNGVKDTATTVFTHRQRQLTPSVASVGGQANVIKRTPGGAWASYLTNSTAIDDKIYLQSTPGSFASIKIPDLSTFSNAIIHRAELITSRIPSTLDNIYGAPFQLFVDRVNNNADTAFILHSDVTINNNFTADLASFGGRLQKDDTYRFNLTRYIQTVVNRKEANSTLRIYAPYITTPFASNAKEKILVFASPYPAFGRVVLGGGNYADPSLRMRLRIVYSKI